jgi:uncharacterized protein with GYD domain
LTIPPLLDGQMSEQLTRPGTPRAGSFSDQLILGSKNPSPSGQPVPNKRKERPMPIYVGLGNWTDQGTKDFRGSVQRGNGFRELVEQAGGRVRELVWTMGEYDFITVLEAPDDETAATLVLRVAAAGNVRTKTMRAFDADQMNDIIARTG